MLPDQATGGIGALRLTGDFIAALKLGRWAHHFSWADRTRTEIDDTIPLLSNCRVCGRHRKSVMRKRNWRLIAVGVVLLALAVLFFLNMRDMTPWSNNPVVLMRTVGEVSGAVAGISIVMIVFGLIGRKAPAS